MFMKPNIASLVALTLFFFPQIVNAQTLLTTLPPQKEVAYTPVKSGKKQIMMGGLAVTSGFALGQPTQYLIAPEKIGKVSFSLRGKYSKLTFMMGPMADSEHISDRPTIVTVSADGRKLLDEKFQDYDISRPFEIDVTGAQEVTFDILAGEGYIGVGKPQLWTHGQNAVKPDYDRTPATTEMVLLKERHPYYYDGKNVVPVSPKDKVKSFKMNGKEYDNGLVMNMQMQIQGGDYGTAMYNLKGQYEKLSFIIGVLDNKVNAEQGQGYLTIQADGKTIYQKDLNQLDMAEQVVLDVTDVDRLSFHSSQNKWNLSAGFADITAWPKGRGPSIGVSPVSASSELKSLPDIVPLMSTIEPFTILGALDRDRMLFTGKSDYLGFDMGGVKHSEGMIFTSGSGFFHDHIFSSASFDLGGEFDYMTFVTGFVDGPMKDSEISIYADDKLLYSVPITVTGMPQKHWVKLDKCRKLTFDNRKGGGNIGVADIILYRGDIKDNSLFVHDVPKDPDKVPLLQYSMPYLHYVYALSGTKNALAYDGSDISKFFRARDGRQINNGFTLETGVRFSVEHGVLSDEGDGGIAGSVGATAVGSSFVTGGMVGGAAVGSTLAGMAGLMLLAAGGEAEDASFAAFNTHGEYESVTFTVECIRPSDAGVLSDGQYTDRQNRLLIGADGNIAAELMLNEKDGPQTFTVPISGCRQLMFFMPCDNGSGTYLIYDAILSKEKSELIRPASSVKSHAVVEITDWIEVTEPDKWKSPDSSGAGRLDRYFGGVLQLYNGAMAAIQNHDGWPRHELHTYYLRTSSGDVVKATVVVDNGGVNAVRNAKGLAHALGANYEPHPVSITRLASEIQNDIENLQKLNVKVNQLKVEQVQAALDVPSLGLRAIKYGKELKKANNVINQCDRVIDMYLKNLQLQYAKLDWLIKHAVNVDGKNSAENVIYSPLAPGETVPADTDLQLVETFR